MSEPKIAQDKYLNNMQFAGWDTTNYQNITADVVFNADHKQLVDITPVAADAWVKIAATTTTPASTEGKLVKVGSSKSAIIPAGWHISASAEINVVPWGH